MPPLIWLFFSDLQQLIQKSIEQEVGEQEVGEQEVGGHRFGLIRFSFDKNFGDADG